MKNRLVLFVALTIIFGVASFAQNNVGIGTTTPHTSALLDLTSTNQGLLIPRVVLLTATNSTSPVNGPATGLLVYNESGSLSQGFYYWNGSEWIMVGAGGSVAGCTTLDEAYDCEGAGAGRQITTSAGSVEITLPLAGSGDSGLDVISDKGTLAAPTGAITAVNNQHGVALIAEITNTSNAYGAIQGISYSGLTGTDLPSGVSGYHDGTGLGVGIWGQTSTNSTAGPSYGIYGLSSGNGNGFGGYFFSNKYPGLFAETNVTNSPAAQFAGAGQVATSPALLTVGWAQFSAGVSPDASSYGVSALINNVAGEITVAPDMGQYGSIGASGIEWYYLYYYNASQASRRELKRNITYLDEDISEYIMADIEKMKPALYKYNIENDEIVVGNELKTRYNMHLGFIVDETPDYVQDNAFNGIDNYSLTSMAISGVQYNRKSIIKLEEKVETLSKQVNDFGIASLSGTEVYVKFNQNFKGTVPVVSVTPNKAVGDFYIKSQNAYGFVLAVESSQNFDFNWIALANVEEESVQEKDVPNINPDLMSQLKVDEARKAQLRKLLTKTQVDPLEIQGADAKDSKSVKFIPAK